MSAHQWRKAQESLVSLERNNVASVDSIVRYDFHRDKTISDLFQVTSHFNLSHGVFNRGGMDANENLRSQFSSAVSSSLDVFDAANGSLLTSIDRE